LLPLASTQTVSLTAGSEAAALVEGSTENICFID
jgi:hypothetical protein